MRNAQRNQFLQWKLTVRTAMSRFLARFGWPHITDETVIQLLPTMFRYLDQHNLIPPGFTYQMFFQTAYKKYIEKRMGQRP